MLSGKERAALRAQANTLETTLLVGKEGITPGLLRQADELLTSHELVKGKVLEAALMTPREVSDAICTELNAEGIACVGSKFVIYRFSEKCQAQRRETGRAHRKPMPVSKSDPVRKGARARRQAMKRQREERNEYFRQQALEHSIARSRERKAAEEQKLK